MIYRNYYKTPEAFSNMIMTSDGEYLTGLWFEKSCEEYEYMTEYEERELSVFDETVKWLDIYFSGEEPEFTPKYKIHNLTSFRKEVLDSMLDIPYGKTTTYGEIAKGIAKAHGIDRMSAQAVGGAVGWNPICIIIPCHRVMGANGKLTGYGGGIENKIALLKLENSLIL